MKEISHFFNSKIIIPQILNKSYLPELDGLRGLAITTVIISHIVITTFLIKYDIGLIGVEIFFVLSGFLITTLLLKEKLKTGSVSFKHFYIRRILRIVPVAYLFLIILLALNYVFQLNISIASFIASAFYVRNLNLHYSNNWFNGHFWTLSIEEQFYIIFPFLLIFNLKIYINVTCFLILCIPILQYVGYNNIGPFHSNFVLHKLVFLLIDFFSSGTTAILIGSLLSILMFNGSLSGKNISCNRYLSFMILIIALIFRMAFAGFMHGTYLISTIFSFFIAIIIYLCITQQNDFLSTILKNKYLLKLGVLSYSIYIWQQIFTHQQPWEHSFKYSDSLFLNIPALFIVAYLSYTFYEKPFLKLKERFK